MLREFDYGAINRETVRDSGAFIRRDVRFSVERVHGIYEIR
jgi:hypothetical protein